MEATTIERPALGSWMNDDTTMYLRVINVIECGNPDDEDDEFRDFFLVECLIEGDEIITELTRDEWNDLVTEYDLTTD